MRSLCNHDHLDASKRFLCRAIPPEDVGSPDNLHRRAVLAVQHLVDTQLAEAIDQPHQAAEFDRRCSESKLLDRAERSVEERIGRRATPEELATETGLTLEQVEESLVHAHGMAMLSLEDNAGSGGGDDGPARLMDCVSLPTSPNPADEAAQREMKVRLAAAIQQLPERERRVIVLYYAEELRLKEIGAVLGITESRVSQLHSRALALLNSKLSDKPDPPERTIAAQPIAAQPVAARSTPTRKAVAENNAEA